MPKWGLTEEMRRAKPWGLPEWALLPGKVITDPVHGDVFLTWLERWFVDSPAVQRLRRVQQLGNTHLVYPGATHTRFSHVLGTLRTTQNLVDIVVDQRNGRYPKDDLFQEWAAAGVDEYRTRVAEATVLARLGALLHDLCHVPFGHSIEDDLRILTSHDENEERFQTIWQDYFDWDDLDPDVRDAVQQKLRPALTPLILPKLPMPDGYKYPFVCDIVGNTICADLMDYLVRDHLYTGLPAKLGTRFIDGFYVTPSDGTYREHKTRMVLRIDRQGRVRPDVLSELFKYLRYRYELSERALVHHAKLAADAMVGKALEMWHDELWVEAAVARHPDVREHASNVDSVKKQVALADSAEVQAIEQIVVARLESELLKRGDAGLLEYLADLPGSANGRQQAIRSLGTDLLARRLYKLAGRCSERDLACSLYKEYGSFAKRSQLEREVARHAGLCDGWKVMLWLPAPQMRFKPADVFVADGDKITKLREYDKVHLNRGKEIYDSHEALWSLSVFVHRSVSDNDQKVILARLAELLPGVRWDGQQVPPLCHLAANEVAKDLRLTSAQEDELAEATHNGTSPRTQPGQESYPELVQRLSLVAQEILRQTG